LLCDQRFVITAKPYSFETASPAAPHGIGGCRIAEIPVIPMHFGYCLKDQP
jgi:hypothetical protein